MDNSNLKWLCSSSLDFSIGLVALDKLGLEVGAYYCSEIDEAARTVVSLNFGTRVTFLGGVEKITRKEVSLLAYLFLC